MPWSVFRISVDGERDVRLQMKKRHRPHTFLFPLLSSSHSMLPPWALGYPRDLPDHHPLRSLDRLSPSLGTTGRAIKTASRSTPPTRIPSSPLVRLSPSPLSGRPRRRAAARAPHPLSTPLSNSVLLQLVSPHPPPPGPRPRNITPRPTLTSAPRDVHAYDPPVPAWNPAHPPVLLPSGRAPPSPCPLTAPRPPICSCLSPVREYARRLHSF
ncbi:hypothetical protein C2E23DRAFT_374930 [Lenzites betulinus]|nr:hypothetical protein C2E23DRAFT_374930 [Lenzites betulinus]